MEEYLGGSIPESYAFHLAQPCKNRGLSFVNNKNGTVTIDGQKFDTIREVDDYLMSVERVDI